MTYNGLTISDKTALLDAKTRGAEWVARDGHDEYLYAYNVKPIRGILSLRWVPDSGDVSKHTFIKLHTEELQFVKWSDAEPVNIDLALAQIEEMESAEKPKNDGCEFCKHFGKPSAVVWDSHVLKMSGKDVPYKPFIKIELHARKNEAELIATSQGDDNKQNKTTVSIRFCPMCGRNLAIPYTKGETK